MNFNNTKGISPTQLRGKQRGQQIQMAIASGIGGRRNEQGEEVRGETAHVLHGAKVFDVWISRTARALGIRSASIQPRKEKGE